MYPCAKILCVNENYIVRLFPASWKRNETKDANKNTNQTAMSVKREDDNQDEPEVARPVASVKRTQNTQPFFLCCHLVTFLRSLYMYIKN